MVYVAHVNLIPEGAVVVVVASPAGALEQAAALIAADPLAAARGIGRLTKQLMVMSRTARVCKDGWDRSLVELAEARSQLAALGR